MDLTVLTGSLFTRNKPHEQGWLCVQEQHQAAERVQPAGGVATEPGGILAANSVPDGPS